jgi:hypothetical protein
MSEQTEAAAAMSTMSEEAELREDVRTAMKQIDEGQGISNRDAKAWLLRRFAR